MSKTFTTTVRRWLGEGAQVSVLRGLELTDDARTLVSNKIERIEVYDSVSSDGRKVAFTPEKARQVAHAILDALDTIDPEAVVNR